MTLSVNRLDNFHDFCLCIHILPLYFELSWDSYDPVSISDVVKRPDSLEWWQFFMNLFTQADTINALCNSYFSNNLSNASSAISIAFTTICFSSLVSSWDVNNGWIIGWLGHSLLFVNKEEPYHHTLGNFDIKEPLLPKSAGFYLVGTNFHLMQSFYFIFAHPIFNKWLITLGLI